MSDESAQYLVFRRESGTEENILILLSRFACEGRAVFFGGNITVEIWAYI